MIDLQGRLLGYWKFRSYWSEQERWCQYALWACSRLAADSPLGTDNQRKKGVFHLALCWVRLNQDRFDEACAEADEAIEILKPIDDRHGVATAYRHLGLIEKLIGESEQDQGCSSQAEEHFAKSREYNEIALGIWRKLGNQREVSSVLANIGHQLIAQGKHSEARDFLEQALVIRREIRDISRISTTLRGLGQLDELEGEFGSAADYYLEARKFAEQVDDKLSAGRAALDLAELKCKQGDYQEAVRLATQADRFFQSLNETAYIERDTKQNKELLRQAQTLQGQGINN